MHVSNTSLYLAALYFHWETSACCQSSGTSPQANGSLKISPSIGEISLLHSFSTLAFSPSGPDAFNNVHLVRPTAWRRGAFRVNCNMSPTENRLAPFEGRVCFMCELHCDGCLELPITKVGFFLCICLKKLFF